MLNSALILPLSTRIDWRAALPPGPTLSAVADVNQPLGADNGNGLTVIETYAHRDRELAYRDLVTAAMLVKLAFRVSTTWNFSPQYPRLQGPVDDRIYADPADLTTPASLGNVDHVKHTSVVADAIKVDQQLYERDLLILQEVGDAAAQVLKSNSPFWAYRIEGYTANVVTLANEHKLSTGFGIRVSVDATLPTGVNPSAVSDKLSAVYYVRVLTATTFTLHPSRAMALANANIVNISGSTTGDNHFAVFSGFGLAISSAWSPADGLDNNAEVHPNLPLNTALFKQPDQALAFRDNQLAAHAANLVQLIKYPFEHADRLLVEFTHSTGTEDLDNREPEVYTLAEESQTTRVWTCEPNLNGRCRLIYDRQAKTLQWVGETQAALHVPQAADFDFDGVVPSQTVHVLADLPRRDHVNLWKQKAGRLMFPGLYDDCWFATGQPGRALVPSTTKTALRLSSGAAVICAEGRASFNCSGTAAVTWAAGTYKLGAIVVHGGTFYTALKTTTATPGTDATAWRQLAPQTNVTVALLVEPTDTLALLGLEQSSNLVVDAGGGVEFDDSHLTATWDIRLPQGNWELQLEYSAKSTKPAPSAFPVEIKFGDQLISVTPLKYGLTPGTAAIERFIVLADPTNTQTLSVNWTTGFGAQEQLIIHKVTFKSNLTTDLRYEFTATLDGTDLGAVDVKGIRNSPTTLKFSGIRLASLTNPVFQLACLRTADAVLLVHKLALALTYPVPGADLTPAAYGFERWRLEMRTRFHDVLTDLYRQVVGTYVVRTGQIVEGESYTVSRGYISYDQTTYGGAGNDTFVGKDLTYFDTVSGNPIVTRTMLPLPSYVNSETKVWSRSSTAAWLDSLLVFEPRLEQALRTPTPLDVGLPALVPKGLIFSGGLVKNYLEPEQQIPTVQAFQPWMDKLGIPCLHRNFANAADRAGWVGEFGRA